MRYCERNEDIHSIEMNLSELNSICKILQRMSIIKKEELYARIGFYSEDVISCLNRLAQNTVSNLDADIIKIKISVDEFYIIRQSFNDVCYSLRIVSYEKEFGASYLNLVAMFDEWKTFGNNLA
jgi:hypothetical protein